MTENAKKCSLMYSESECKASKGDNCEWKLESHVNGNSASFPNKPASSATCSEEQTDVLGSCTHATSKKTNCKAIYKCKHLNFEK